MAFLISPSALDGFFSLGYFPARRVYARSDGSKPDPAWGLVPGAEVKFTMKRITLATLLSDRRQTSAPAGAVAAMREAAPSVSIVAEYLHEPGRRSSSPCAPRSSG